jgi:hypothetical protein
MCNSMCAKPGSRRRTLQALLVARIRPSPNHLDQLFEMMRVDKTDDSSGIGAQRLYVDHAAATRAYLDALVFICPEVKLLVTDRASKSYLFHIGCYL